MAEAIAEAGHELHIWARRPATLEPLRDAAIVHPTRAALAQAVEHIGICVGSETDVQTVLFEDGLVPAAGPGTVIAVHSTISPAAVQRFARESAAHDIELIDAPVSGGRKRAQERRLLVMVGAEEEVFERALPVLLTYGNPVRLLGPVGSGEQAKILNNLLMNANLAHAHLVLEFARHLGIARHGLRELLSHGTAASFALAALDTIVVPGEFAVATATKDLQLGREMLALIEEKGNAQEVALGRQMIDVTSQVNQWLGP